jgi:hypothetical protein
MSHPSQLYFIYLAAGTNSLGAFSATDDQQLQHLVVTLLKSGTAGGSERLRVKLYNDAALTELYATGSWVTLASLISGSTHWLGAVRLDLSDVWIEGGQTYHAAVETDSYTPNDVTYWLGVSCDWPLQENAGDEEAAKMSLYGLRSAEPT